MVVQYDWGTPLYAISIRLRDNILRKPLGLVFNAIDLEKEYDYFHYAILGLDYSMSACLILVPDSEKNIIRLKQMAVDKIYQKQGYGSKLVNYIEKDVKYLGYNYIELHARINAVGFYEKLGYHISGQVFVEVGIEHYKMRKRINNI